MSRSVTTDAMRQEKKQRKREEEYRSAVKSLPRYTRIALGLIAVALLLFTVTWAQIYNTDIPGAEVSVNGFACVAAGITRNYTSTSAVYGDMAVPFYYFASAWCESLSSLTLAAFIAAVVGVALQAVMMFRQKTLFNLAAELIDLAAGVLLILCFTTALSMKNSDILPYYCSGNPACSIQSYAIVPALIALAAAAANGFAAVKYIQAQKLLKD